MHGRGIPAVRDRTGDTAAFQINGHCFLLPQHLRAAKWHFYPDTTRPRTARNLRTRTPQGDGNFLSNVESNQAFEFKNQNPARGRKLGDVVGTIMNKIHLRTRTPQGDGNRYCSLSPDMNFTNLRTRTPQGDGNVDITWYVLGLTRIFKNQNPARGRSVPLASPARAGERSTSANHTSLTLVFLGRFPIRPVTQSAAPEGLLLGQVSRGTA